MIIQECICCASAVDYHATWFMSTSTLAERLTKEKGASKNEDAGDQVDDDDYFMIFSLGKKLKAKMKVPRRRRLA